MLRLFDFEKNAFILFQNSGPSSAKLATKAISDEIRSTAPILATKLIGKPRKGRVAIANQPIQE